MTMRRALRLASISGAAAVIGAALAVTGLWFYAAQLGPLDLAQASHRSVAVNDRNGTLLRAFTTPEGLWRLPVEVRDVDPRLVALLKAYEDRRFDSHHGVDPRAMLRAAWQALSHGRIVSGGSTLTMQVARLLEPRPERTLTAKLRQMVRAIQLEHRFTKDEILGLYLSLAPYGGNIEGVRAASLIYFGKEPRRLSLGEAALLVALPQSPEARRPDRHAHAARRARDRVLDRVVAQGAVVPAEAAYARSEAVPDRRRAVPMLAAHAAETAVRAQSGKHAINLTLDAGMQAGMESLLREHVAALGPKLSGAILVIDNATGHVLAHAGSPDYLSVERAGAVDGAQALRSPGSALKPFIYALAFEEGIAHPETLLEDAPARFGAYRPENFDLAFTGQTTARRALQQSLNVPAVELLARLGPERFLARLRQAGADVVVPKDQPPGLAIGLGGVGIRLVDLAGLYVALARGGESVPLRWRANDPAAQPRSLTGAVPAWYVWDILKDAPAPLNAVTGRIAFKTGTSYGYRDAWSAGFDRRITVAVWLGRPDNNAVPWLIGRQAAAPVLFDAFARIGASYEPLPRPSGVLAASNAGLPPPLRRLRNDAPQSIAATPRLRIAFPPDGARLALERSRDSSAGTVALKANGGAPPLTWFVNGAPVTEGELRRQTLWRPDGPGFARVSVMDARGASDSVAIRLDDGR